VEIIEDIPMEDPVAQEAARLELLKLFRPALPEDLAQSDAFSDLLSQHIPLGSLTDVIAYAINFPQAIKQLLLGEHRVQVRYQILAEQLAHWANTSKSNNLANEKPIRSFDGNPPPFSVN
jgi:hypothetical protein